MRCFFSDIWSISYPRHKHTSTFKQASANGISSKVLLVSFWDRFSMTCPSICRYVPWIFLFCKKTLILAFLRSTKVLWGNMTNWTLYFPNNCWCDFRYVWSVMFEMVVVHFCAQLCGCTMSKNNVEELLINWLTRRRRMEVNHRGSTFPRPENIRNRDFSICG